MPVRLPYFPDYKPRLFFKHFRVSAYIAVRLMCGRFQKTMHYTLHATACLDQHLITISSPTHIYFRPVFSFFLLFFPRLISVVADWMSTVLLHMVWPYCEFRMQVGNVVHAARWKCGTQKIAICAPMHNFGGLYLCN